MKLFLITLLIFSSSTLFSVEKIAVLPFNNADGLYKNQIWVYDIQDSLAKSLKAADPNQEHYEVISPDEIEDVLAELNLDPSNPQYKSDMWKAAKMLKVKTIITGRFNFEAGNIIINAFIYNVRMKLPHPKYQAKNIFKPEDQVLSAIPIITEKLLPGLKKN